MNVAIDCANGAFYKFAPKILKELGADVGIISSEPNGRNINKKCGSTYIENLSNFMQKGIYDIGFSFDGDGDRVIAVSWEGKKLDGDYILGILAQYLKSKNKLKNNTFVATIMSNLGLKLAMKQKGINIIETDVGDRYVYEAMTANDSVLGGEQSGHIILKEYNNTGDGFMAALAILQVLKDLGKKKFFELVNTIHKMPQVLVNVTVNDKKNINDLPKLRDAKRKIDDEFNGKGRVLIRYSGTEPLMRIMIEGENQVQIQNKAEEFAKLVKNTL